MREGYERLFAEIYKQAVHDDVAVATKRVKKQLEEIYRPKGSPRYVKQSPKILIGYKIKAEKFVVENKEYIKERVQKYVYKESQEWGSGTTRAIQAREMNALIEELVKEGV